MVYIWLLFKLLKHCNFFTLTLIQSITKKELSLVLDTSLEETSKNQKNDFGEVITQ